MTLIRWLPFTALLLFIAPMPVLAQALPSVALERVIYGTRKATVRPTGTLAVRIDSVDAALADATRLGRTGEIRRLLAKGRALLDGREWTDALDYETSLVLRADRVIVDPARPYVVRVEQLYAPSIRLPPELTAQATLHPRGPRSTGAVASARPVEYPLAPLRQWPVAAASRDLATSPQRFELDLAGIPSGDYDLVVTMRSGEATLATTALAVHIRPGLDSLVARLENDAKRAPGHLRADILYPVDRLRQVNAATVELRTFDPARELAAADSVAVAVRAGRDPFAKRTGDFERHHLLRPADEILPYRVYVPTSYSRAREFPLVIALHGLGGTEDSFFDSFGGEFPRLAEQRGYILAAPLGYRPDAPYGWGLGEPPADRERRRAMQLSEQDVMQVLARMRRDYNIDDDRIYLIGHSLGAIGTLNIAQKYPDRWAGLAAFAGGRGAPTLDLIREIPTLVVHGDADATADVLGARILVATMRRLGMNVRYIEVPGGTHGGVVGPNAGAMFDFFDSARRGKR